MGSLRLSAETSATMAVCDADRLGAIRYTGGDFSFCRNGSAWETLTSVAASADRIVSGSTSVIVNSATGIISSSGQIVVNTPSAFRAVSGNYGVVLRNDGVNFYLLQTPLGDPYGAWNALRPFGFNLISGDVFLAASSTTGVTVGSNTSSTAKMDIRGTLRIGAGTEACDVSRTGAIKFTGGDFSFCRNGSTWETLASVTGGSDRIVSGTSSVVVNSATGVVSLTQAATGWGYLAPSGFSYLPNLQTLSISATGPVNVENNVAGGANINIRNNSLNSSATAALSIAANGAALGIIAINSSATYLAGSTGRPGGMAIYTSIGTGGGLTLASRHPSGSMYFYTGGTASQRMVLDEAGRLGIGTPSPNAKLDVSGTVSTTDVFLAKTSGQCSTAADIGRMFRSATTGRLQICADRN